MCIDGCASRIWCVNVCCFYTLCHTDMTVQLLYVYIYHSGAVVSVSSFVYVLHSSPFNGTCNDRYFLSLSLAGSVLSCVHLTFCQIACLHPRYYMSVSPLWHYMCIYMWCAFCQVISLAVLHTEIVYIPSLWQRGVAILIVSLSLFTFDGQLSFTIIQPKCCSFSMRDGVVELG